MEDKRKYKFDWDNTIGVDMNNARPNLGTSTRIEVYRLFQFTLRDVLEQHYGTEMADTLFREAGVIAGKAFFEQFLSDTKDIASFITKSQELLNTLGVGILHMESSAEDNSQFVFTVEEDLDCSGLPDIADVVCVYDEGFIQGLLESALKKKFNVREIDCWCTGDRVCRFKAKLS